MPALEENNHRPIRVLVVDDSDVILYALKHFFEDYNFDVITCIDGLEGLQKAVELKPNLIFLDLMMPNFDGLKMLQVKKVLQDIKDIPVIVISANTDRRNVLAAIEAGADKVISKPLQKEIIFRFVNELLGNRLVDKSLLPQTIIETDQAAIQKELVNVFLDSFIKKKEAILTGVQMRNTPVVKSIIHEIKGAGSTIGQPLLTEIAGEIDKKDISTETDWMFVELKCNQIFQIVKRLEEERKKELGIRN